MAHSVQSPKLKNPGVEYNKDDASFNILINTSTFNSNINSDLLHDSTCVQPEATPE